MTLHEAIDKKIARVRTEPWNEYSHVLLPDFHGPWAKLVDPCSNLALGKAADHVDSIIMVAVPDRISFDPNEDIWDEWVPPADYVERFGEPPKY
jgi:hypothetical protein